MNILYKFPIKNFSLRNMFSKRKNITPIEDKKFTHFDEPNNEFTLLHDQYIISSKAQYKKDYNKITQIILKLKDGLFLDKNYDKFQEICYDVEKNINNFKVEHLIKISSTFAEKNLKNYAFLDYVQNNIGDRIYSDLPLNNIEDKEMTRILLNYFKNVTDISLMRIRNLDYILNYFASNHKYIFNNENATYDFIWLISLSISTHYYLKNFRLNLFRYTDGKKNPLSERGSKNLMFILDKASQYVNKNHSENINSKVRLYRALYYLKAEGLILNEKLESFLLDFKPFYNMNSEHKISNTLLEEKFNDVLVNKNIKAIKEKKLDFCTVDFFVEPNIIYEINGPTHYYDFIPRAKDILKYRVLELQNYQLEVFHYECFENESKKNEMNERLDQNLNLLKMNDEIIKTIDYKNIKEEIRKGQKKRIDAFVPNIVISEINH